MWWIRLEIIQIAGLAVIAVALISVIKQQKPEFGLMAGIIAGIIIFMFVVSKIAVIVSYINNFAEKANVNSNHLSLLLKIIGISYVAEFASEICKDAGETAIASKVELAAKVIIVAMSMPIVGSLLDLVIRIMP